MMPISEEQTAKMKEKRKKILEEAIILFSEQGYNDTTISKVAKAADVSFGSVFTYFKNKDELFNCAVIEPLEEYSKEILNFSIDGDNPISEIEQLVSKHIKLFANIGTYLRLVTQVVGQFSKFPDQFKELDTFHNEFKEKLAKLVMRGQELGQLKKLDPYHTATAYLSFLMGLRLTLADGPDHKVWEEYVPFAIQLFGLKD